jgi:hypothetical protein
MSVLPEALFDGQQFVDNYGILWIYMSATNCWRREGKVNAIPVATTTSPGLLPSKYKYLLDSIPPKGGGFALITKPLLSKRTQENPDGVLFGNVELVSDSLDITCVDSDGKLIGDACKVVAFKEYDEQPPGFDINFSEKLLETLCVEVPGGPGPKGIKGEKGDPGADGTGDGPQGLQGEKGKDATTRSKLVGVQIVDIQDIFDTAVVKLDLDAPNGKLFVTKAKVALPTDENQAAEKLVVSQINRLIEFTDCWDYQFKILPCRPGDDFDIGDPLVAFYPESFDPNKITDRPVQLVRGRLSDVVNGIIDFYKSKLTEAATKWDKQIEEFIKSKDEEARKVLDDLGVKLAECEHITYLDYCVGIDGTCNTQSTGSGNTDQPQTEGGDPNCNSLLALINGEANPAIPVLERRCTDKAASKCRTIGDIVVSAKKLTPVLSLKSIPPYTNPQSLKTQAQISAAIKARGELLEKNAKDAFILFPKEQLKYSDSAQLFPPGTYVFQYLGGSFRQERRTNRELGIDPREEAAGKENRRSAYITGPFNDYFVGNEGDGLPGYQVAFVYGHDVYPTAGPLPFASTAIGLQIGFAPQTYVNQIPENYFDTHAFDMFYEVGNPKYELPNPRVDHSGLPASAIAMENLIRWQTFPKIGGTHSDALELQQLYLGSDLQYRSIVITTTEPGYFFSRVRGATSFCSATSRYVMPPVTPAGGLGRNQFGPIPIRDISFNTMDMVAIGGRISLVAQEQPTSIVNQPNATITYGRTGYTIPFVDAKPYVDGEVRLRVTELTCSETAEEETTTLEVEE